MATLAQMQRTVAKTHVTARVSQELVQTMLSASFGCISYLRGIFPDDNFFEERYNAKPADVHNGKCGVAVSSTDGGQRVMKLKRDFSPEATELLDCLETGVYDALKHGYLMSIILSISLDPQEANNVHEAYTFQFSYSGDSKAPSLLIRDKNGGRSTTPMPLDAARRSMQQLFRQLITMTQSLSPLPDHLNKFLAIRLFYNENTPEDYQPPGFREASTSESARFVTRFEDDRPFDQEIGSLNTGFHACTLKITTLDDIDEDSSHRVEAIKLWDAEHNAKTVCKAHAPDVLFVESPYLDPTIHKQTTSAVNQLEDEIISGMSQQEPTQLLTEGLSQTVTARDASLAPEAKSMLQENNANTSARGKTGVDKTPACVADLDKEYDKMKITQTGASQKPVDQRVTARHAATRTSKTRGSQPSMIEQQEPQEDVIACECGDLSEDGIMVQCDQCQCWSHVPCYGYWDSVIEEGYSHLCYTCKVKDPEELENLRSIAIVRRALIGLWTDGYVHTSTRDFGKSIGIEDLRTADGILRRLVQEGWLEKVSAKSAVVRKNGKFVKRKPMYEVVRNPTSEQKMLARYFDPGSTYTACAETNNEKKNEKVVAEDHTSIPAASLSQGQSWQKMDITGDEIIRDSINDPQPLSTFCSKPSQSQSAASCRRSRSASVASGHSKKRTRGSSGSNDDTTDDENEDLGVLSQNLAAKANAAPTTVRRSSTRIKRLRVSITAKPIVARPYED